MQVKEILLADIIDRPIFLTVKNDNNFKYTIKGDTRNLKFQKTNKTLNIYPDKTIPCEISSTNDKKENKNEGIYVTLSKNITLITLDCVVIIVKNEYTSSNKYKHYLKICIVLFLLISIFYYITLLKNY